MPPLSRRRRVLIALLVGVSLTLVWGCFGTWSTSASLPILIDSNDHGYTVRTFRLRSPLRVFSDSLNFMPHSAPGPELGTDQGYATYLLKDGKRIVQVRRQLPSAPATLRGDGAFYAYYPPGPDPELVVVRVSDGKRLSFELEEWGYLRWAMDDQVVVWRKGPSGGSEAIVSFDLPEDFVH